MNRDKPSENAMRRTRVLPNRNVLGLAAVILAMWYAGASQSNGAAYLLCFVLMGVTLVSTLHAWANLRGIEMIADPMRPAFVGEELRVRLHARSRRDRAHFGINVRSQNSEVAKFETIPAGGDTATELALLPTTRGIFTTLDLRLDSRYPLGFFTASSRLKLSQPHVVYPAPEGNVPLPISVTTTLHSREGHRIEGDDFGGVRAWRRGESQRHIDWKAAARGQPLLVKQWFGEADETLHFEWQSLGGVESEARLSQLAKWIILAERKAATYSLELPGISLAAARGEAHYHACLRALAQYSDPLV